jgi:hypothetical protein
LPWHRFDISKGIPVRRLHPHRVPEPRTRRLSDRQHRTTRREIDAPMGCQGAPGALADQ